MSSQRIAIIVILFIVLLSGIWLTLKIPYYGNAKFFTSSQIITPSPTRAQATAEIINTNKPVNGWKQYVNSKDKYSFSYPADWQILDEPNVSGIEIQKIDFNGGFSISVRIIENPENLTLEDFAKNQVYHDPNGVKDVPQKITLRNLSGFKLQYLPEGLLANIFLPYNSKEVLNIFAGGEFAKDFKTRQHYQNIIDEFLNSFKLD